MENFGKFMVIVLTIMISPIINGYVFTKLWYWFIVPVFQMNPLRIIEAVGIMVLISFIRYRSTTDKGEDFWITFTTQIIHLFVIAATYLLWGYIAKQFM